LLNIIYQINGSLSANDRVILAEPCAGLLVPRWSSWDAASACCVLLGGFVSVDGRVCIQLSTLTAVVEKACLFRRKHVMVPFSVSFC